MSKKTYDCVIERNHNEINNKIIDFLKTKIYGKYLDVGANTGWLIREKEGGIGVDSSIEMVNKSNGLIRLANANNLPFKDKEFDIVVMSCVLEQCDDWEIALKEAMRVGKKVIGINPYPGSTWGKIGGWVKSIIPTDKFTYIKRFDKDRYYFEI